MNIRIINKLHLLKQPMLEVYHMETQILLDKPVRVTWERQTNLGGLEVELRLSLTFPVFSKSKELSGIKARESSPLGGHLPLTK